MIPIDVCQTIIFTQRDFERIKTISKTGVRLSQIAGCYLDYYQHNPRFGQKKGAIIYDLLVISYLMRPNLFELKPATVRVKTNQKQNFGQTQLVRVQSNQANCRLVTKANGDKIKQLFFQEIGA